MSTSRVSRMRRVSIFCASVFALSVLLPSAMGVAAQTSGDSYVTDMGGYEVAWSSDWEIDEELTVSEENVEAVFLSQDRVALTVAFLPEDTILVNARDVMISGFQGEDAVDDTELIDAGAYDNIAYELDRAVIDGVEMGVFTLIADRGATGGVMALMFVAPSETFDVDLTSAQNDITVDDDPIFEGIDPAGLQELLNASDL